MDLLIKFFLKYFLFIFLIFIACDDDDPIASSNCAFQDITGTCCNSNEIDCNNICFGNSQLDQCDICNGDGCLCNGCADDSATNFDSEASSNKNCIYESYAGTLLWNDEFDSDELDLTKWGFNLGTGEYGWGNQEAQYYTDSSENIYLENGKLIIKAKADNHEGSAYTSARIYSRNCGKNWKYGRVEVRAKLPTGIGTWPAIWMFPANSTYGNWPASGEIDIMEHAACNLNTVAGNIHCTDHNHSDNTHIVENNTTSNYNVNEFHTYRIDWDEDLISWFVDDVQYFQYPNDGNGANGWPFDQEFHLILNLAVGGTFGTCGGTIDIDHQAFIQQGQTFEIEYVRVFE